jgi:hypothetical protein
MEDLQNFKSELATLLSKYEATLTVNVDGDTHGLSYEFVVDFGSKDRFNEYKLARNAYLDADDLSR